MKKTNLLLLLILTISILSCSSDNDENPQIPNQTCKISQINYNFFSGDNVFNSSYNGNLLSSLTSSEEKVEYTYDSNNHLILKEFYEIGNPQVLFKSEFITDTQGNVIEVKHFEYYNNSLQYNGKHTYHYNGNKLIEIKNYALDNTTIEGRFTLDWTGNNPTLLTIYD